MVRLRLIGAASLLLLAACAQPPGGASGPEAEIAALRSDPAAAADLAADFDAAAFLEVGLDFARRRALVRAPEPIFVNVGTSGPAAARGEQQIVTLAVNSLRSGAGLDITMTNQDPIALAEAGKTRTGFMIFFADTGQFDAMLVAVAEATGQNLAQLRGTMTDAGCAGVQFTDAGWKVTMITVSTGLPNFRQSYCVHREISANLGLAGFLDRTDSIMGKTNTFPRYSGRDLVLMRMLYDPRLRPGMTAAQARPLLPAIATDALAR